MRIEVVDGEGGWPLVEALDAEVYSPEVMSGIVWRDVTWAEADKRVIVQDNESVRCHVGVFWRNGLLNAAPVKIAGIGGVMTSKVVRRQGYATAALRCAENLMTDRGIDFGMLFCEPHNERFYATLGWELFDGNIWAMQPAGAVRFDVMRAMWRGIRMRTAPKGHIDLCGLPW